MKNIIHFLLVLLVMSTTLQAQQGTSSDEEFSYKTGKQIPRYLKKFREMPLNLPEDYSSQIKGIDSIKQEIVDMLVKSAISASNFPWFMKIENENAVFILTDLGNARFTLQIDQGNFLVTEGVDNTHDITMVIPLIRHNLEDLVEIFSDGKMTYEEQYRIYYFITIPALEAIYRNKLFYQSDDMSDYKFDDLIHLVIPQEELVYFTGVPKTIEVTIANVDGQWLIFRGLQGDPDFRISANLNQAFKLYKLGFYDVRNIKSKKEAKEVSKNFLDLLNSLIVYTRPDHLSAE